MKTSTLITGLILSLSLVFFGNTAFAGNDSSIKGNLRADIQASMNNYIQANTIDGTYHLFDAVSGKMLNLKFKQLHSGIVKKGNYYVSCADFTDSRGKLVDLDFLVMADGDQMKTIQSVVHSMDGKKRKYHLE